MTARLHVTTETRTVYRSVRGAKLTRHAAYIAAAKALIAARCAKWNDEREDGYTSTDHNGNRVVSENANAQPCSTVSDYKCRFHSKHYRIVDMTGQGHMAEEPQGMLHYRRVLDRLVRFLKYVDAKRTEAPR
jgi:hypothetical protein